ncbi:MAG: beta-propeller domain-containing protein, partial [Acidimicrobiia bacterium]
HDGVLRVATTAGAPWLWGSGPDSESFVTTLRADGAELRRVGRVGELGKGERIYAVRFIGTNGYVVTFRQTDPLYVVDLADPAAPRVTGELKINGYSAYLHPLSDGRLLGVGQDATDEGRVTGAQVSIFDVSDPAAPTRTATFTMPQSNLSTEYDYKAFLYWAPEELVLLPYNSYGDDGSFESGALGLNIGETITERGRIVSTPIQQDCGYPTPLPTIIDDETGADGSEGGSVDSGSVEPSAPVTTLAEPGGAGVSSPGFPGSDAPVYCPSWAPPIERTVVIGPSVYAVAPGHVQAAAIDTLTAQGSVDFS